MPPPRGVFGCSTSIPMCARFFSDSSPFFFSSFRPPISASKSRRRCGAIRPGAAPRTRSWTSATQQRFWASVTIAFTCCAVAATRSAAAVSRWRGAANSIAAMWPSAFASALAIADNSASRSIGYLISRCTGAMSTAARRMSRKPETSENSDAVRAALSSALRTAASTAGRSERSVVSVASAPK